VLAADEIRDSPEHERADERGAQHCGIQQGQPARTQMPVLRDERRGDPDDEQVICVGEEAHPGHQRRAQVKPAHRGVIQRGDQVS